MANRSISGVDLFCGVGGLTHGLVQGGINVTAGVDMDPTCKYPYEENNNGASFIEGDISKVSAKEIEKHFKPGSIRVLAGCAPCQPFSSYARKYDNNRDNKWALIYEFERLLKGIRPDIITMENVPAVRTHRVFKRFIKTLEKLKYKVWYDVVDCSQYGVPQKRMRTVLLASRHGDLKLIDATHETPKTVKQAIGRLKPIKAGEGAENDRMHVCASLNATNMKRIKVSKPGGTWRDWPKSLVVDCHKSESGKTFPSVYGRMQWDKPAPTMTTQCFGFGNGRFGHPEQDRAISLREAAILQGFPRNYKFVPPRKEVEFVNIGRLIGNAVPVDLGRAIAVSIKKHVKEVNAIPKRMGQSK